MEHLSYRLEPEHLVCWIQEGTAVPNTAVPSSPLAMPRLAASLGKAEILAEKWKHVVLEPVRHRTGVRAGVDLE